MFIECLLCEHHIYIYLVPMPEAWCWQLWQSREHNRDSLMVVFSETGAKQTQGYIITASGRFMEAKIPTNISKARYWYSLYSVWKGAFIRVATKKSAHTWHFPVPSLPQQWSFIWPKQNIGTSCSPAQLILGTPCQAKPYASYIYFSFIIQRISSKYFFSRYHQVVNLL